MMSSRAFIVLLGITSSLLGMQNPATRTLSSFPFQGASVLIRTMWPSKTTNYFVLTREMFGPDKGTYDAFGGSRDQGETHPVATASRELFEETMGLLGNKQSLLDHIDVKGNNQNTLHIIANDNKKVAVYITQFDHKAVERLTNDFYKPSKGREKDMIAHVREDNLRNAIANAPRNAQGQLIQPILVEAQVMYPNGSRKTEHIPLRPVLVSALQSYFKGTQNFTSGKDPRIRFYAR